MQVTVEDIEALEGEYRGSAEETAELLELHERFSGDMGKARHPLKAPAASLCPAFTCTCQVLA